ncbi:putative protein family protein [Erysiphe neolycopersici]|uniref:Outer spore wall protein RRT8 n=1 Tax=Erysiphe neolycopersici TaxID=212602 RepID=A0A420I0I4_9PEZI|nr:putative protein family protein [Erysiphe neolycopersici]
MERNRMVNYASVFENYRYAIRSGTHKYAFKGIVYFIKNRKLWKPLIPQLTAFFTASYIVIFFMFLFTYIPQLAVLSFFHGPMAFFLTFFLILNESSFLITLIFRPYLKKALANTFDEVLAANDQAYLLSGRNELKLSYFNDPVTKLGTLVKLPHGVLSSENLTGYLLFLPLTFIPVVGMNIFIGVQAQARGCIVHNRYFQLKGWSRSEVNEWIRNDAAHYILFGFVATILEMIPFASVFFSFTNTVGAALWAVDVEHQQIRDKNSHKD